MSEENRIFTENMEGAPDKIIGCKMHNNGEKIIHKFYTFRKLKSDEEIVGYIKPDCRTEKPENNAALVFEESGASYYIPVKKNTGAFRRCKGYINVGDGQFIGLTQNIIPFLLIPFLLVPLAVLLVALFLSHTGFFSGNGEAEKLEISNNIVFLDEKPDTAKPVKQSSMAYVSGQAVTTVTAEQPYVYLQNSEDNEEYYLEYDVYVGDGEDPVYKSKLIPCNTAETWDAYKCEQVVSGENIIWYDVHIYNLQKELVANTRVDGLKLIKMGE